LILEFINELYITIDAFLGRKLEHLNSIPIIGLSFFTQFVYMQIP